MKSKKDNETLLKGAVLITAVTGGVAFVSAQKNNASWKEDFKEKIKSPIKRKPSEPASIPKPTRNPNSAAITAKNIFSGYIPSTISDKSREVRTRLEEQFHLCEEGYKKLKQLQDQSETARSIFYTCKGNEKLFDEMRSFIEFSHTALKTNYTADLYRDIGYSRHLYYVQKNAQKLLEIEWSQQEVEKTDTIAIRLEMIHTLCDEDSQLFQFAQNFQNIERLPKSEKRNELLKKLKTYESIQSFEEYCNTLSVIHESKLKLRIESAENEQRKAHELQSCFHELWEEYELEQKIQSFAQKGEWEIEKLQNEFSELATNFETIIQEMEKLI